MAATDAPRDSEDSARAATINRVPLARIRCRRSRLANGRGPGCATAAPTLAQPTMPQPRVTAWIGWRADPRDDATDQRGRDDQEPGGFRSPGRRRAAHEPRRRDSRAFTAAPRRRRRWSSEEESGETKADANTIDAPAPVAEAPAAATATAEVSAPATAETAAVLLLTMPPRGPDARRLQENQQKEEERKQKK